MKTFLAFMSILGVMLLGTDGFAATCSDPVPAPKYQVGDRFIWKYANGSERAWEVIGFEGNLAQVKWSDTGALWASDREGTYFFDQDWVIRKGVTKKGDVLLSPMAGIFSKIGMKDLDFPLQVGKTWEFTHRTKVYSTSNITNYHSTLRVVGCEEVATPAGKFMALKVEHEEATDLPTAGAGWGTIYRWYSPDAKNIVKAEFGRWNGSMTPSVLQRGAWSTRPVAYEIMKLELR